MCATPIVRRMQRMHWHLLHYYNKEMQYQVTGVMVTITTQHILRDLDVWVRPGQVPGTVVTMGWSRVCQYTCFYVSELLGQWVLGKSSVPSLCWYPDPVSAITTGHMSYHEELSCFGSEKWKKYFYIHLIIEPTLISGISELKMDVFCLHFRTYFFSLLKLLNLRKKC